MKPIEQKDILIYRFLSDPQYNPAHTRAAFVVSTANETENGYESRLWLYENDAVKQLTDLGKERGYLWLDDDRLIFPAVRSAAEKKRAEAKEPFTSYYVLDLQGGEALPFFTVPFAVSELKVLDEKRFLAVGSFHKDHPDLYAADEETRRKILKEKEDDKDYEVFDELPFWSNGAGVVNGQRRRLFLITLDPLTVTHVSGPGEDMGGFAVLRDEVFYAVQERGPKMLLKEFTVKARDLKTGTTRDVFHTDSFMLSHLETVGDHLLLFGGEGKRYGLNENDYVYEIDPVTGERKTLFAAEYSLYNSVGSDARLGGGRECVTAEDSLYHLITRGGDAVLYRLDMDGTDTPVFTKPGAMDCFDVADGKALCVGLYDMRPQELYLCDYATGEAKRLTDFNGSAIEDRYIAQPEPLSIKSEGLTIEGWVLKPFGYDPAKRYPAVFDIHGGPKTVYGPVFYHEMQYWAGKGYFVFFCNPKGSDGGDNAFADIRGGYGDVDYKNLMAFCDAILAAYPAIDPKRVCETGGSYGGFMTNWIIGHTDRFCCCASQRSISNWLSFCGVSDIGNYFAPDQTGGDLYDDPTALWAQSPLKYAKNVKTPTLFIHSDEDYRCPLEQGLQMYSALVDRGIPARLCLFHGENHELSRSGKPLHRLRRLREITAWFDKYSAEK
ncbi:MAG: S9 family peptidase [Clostridia bacterium]|nr:S9 family peptidase [Clostridia bacterium]